MSEQMDEKDHMPSPAAQAAHKAFHEAWGGFGNDLDLYVTSPIWEGIADAVRTQALNAAADAVAFVRAHGLDKAAADGVIPEGSQSAPYSDGFERWLRDRGSRPGSPTQPPPPEEAIVTGPDERGVR